MKGVDGLVENFYNYYKEIMEKPTCIHLKPQERNSCYERFRMAEAFYRSILLEGKLSTNQKTELIHDYTAMYRKIEQIQHSTGDRDLRASGY